MSMQNNYEYEHLPQEKFAFVQMDISLHDKKLETKSRSYFADAMLRFKKNKSSVIAAWIIAFLLLFSIVSPIISPYSVDQQDKMYINKPPFVRQIAEDFGIMNAAVTQTGQNERAMNYWRGVAEETGYDPVIGILDEKVTYVKQRGQEVANYTYTLSLNSYYMVGMMYLVVSYEEFAQMQQWQNETGIQLIYPYVEPKDIAGIDDNPNIWYKVKNETGEADLDGNGNFIPAYSSNQAVAGAAYNSIRIPGDDGSYIYSGAKSGSVQIRVCYYNYYQYLNGREPMFIFGTNSMGQDLFAAIGVGARFSILFAILVSAINLVLGAIYGSIQGYYGGYIDLFMDRVADILSGVPFIVCATLFQLHLAQKVGVVPSFLFAFVLTGWISMSALTRKQFYRFKSQEFVLAARTLGASDWRLMFKHVFPNSLGTIITSAALVIPGVISSETQLTYLGIVNLQEFAGTSIGTLMSQGQAAMTTAPYGMFWPALFVSLLLISFNLFGNGLRDAFNPSTRGAED